MSTIIKFKDKKPKIHDSAYIGDGVFISGDVKIDEKASIWPNCTIRGDIARVEIGAETNIQDNTVIHVAKTSEENPQKGHTIVGKGVTVGHSAVLHACKLEDYAFVGMSATVMDEVVVESFGMIAAGALVTPNKRIKSGEIWAGSPARFMRKLSQEEMDYFKTSAENYAKWGQEYKKEQEERK